MARRRKGAIKTRCDGCSARANVHRQFVSLMAFVCSLIGAAFAASAVATAQTSVSPPGRLLASNCAQCHGTTDTSPGFERLTGKSASKLLKELRKYQSGAEGEGIMTRHAMGYTEEQLRQLVQWLSQQR